MIFAAIDIGSNAVRLLFSHVHEQKGKAIFKKGELIRLPIRLGDDSFTKKEISPEKAEKLVTAMRGFSEIIKVFDVISMKACATSAMRDASNGAEIIARIKKESGINVEIIDGKTEAATIFSNHVEELMDPKQAYLYIDVGGGSTELTLISNRKVLASKSFNIGTIRILCDKVEKEEWEHFKTWIKKNTAGVQPLTAIGSGGNINKLYKMSGKKENKHLSYDKVKDMYDMLNSYTYDERVTVLGLNPDRADVIIPATKIFLTTMKHADIEKVLVPQIGLSDGIIHLLYEEHIAKKKK
ncbi:MAG: exopolyphosphatase [Bacteroidota bacterium]|nr:exopolyphosphatase [Bacteroidota bacterium]